MWSSPTTKSLDPIVVTALRVGFPGESHGPATCGFACNCPEPEAWTTEASGRMVATMGMVTTMVSNDLVVGEDHLLGLIFQRYNGKRAGEDQWPLEAHLGEGKLIFKSLLSCRSIPL